MEVEGGVANALHRRRRHNAGAVRLLLPVQAAVAAPKSFSGCQLLLRRVRRHKHIHACVRARACIVACFMLSIQRLAAHRRARRHQHARTHPTNDHQHNSRAKDTANEQLSSRKRGGLPNLQRRQPRARPLHAPAQERRRGGARAHTRLAAPGPPGRPQSPAAARQITRSTPPQSDHHQRRRAHHVCMSSSSAARAPFPPPPPTPTPRRCSLAPPLSTHSLHALLPPARAHARTLFLS